MGDDAGFLDRYLGCEVEVHYAAGGGNYRDQGQFLGSRDGWVELGKPGADVFLIPVAAIRLMKVLGLPPDPTARLLRPVDQEAPGDDPRGAGLRPRD